MCIDVTRGAVQIRMYCRVFVAKSHSHIHHPEEKTGDSDQVKKK